MAFIEIENLSFTYNGADKRALDCVSLSIERGDFVVVSGKSGCGKTTLLKMLKRQLTPAGKIEGKITLDGNPLSSLDERESVAKIQMVMQNPDSQIVSDKAWHELVFCLENLGENPRTVMRKVAEACGFLGIGDIYKKNTSELSGGKKQLLNLASVIATGPDVLLLDEPTAQLDPVAANSFLSCLKRLNEESGVTVIIVEHRLDDVFPMATKALIMDHGKVVSFSAPEKIVGQYGDKRLDSLIFSSLPAPVKLFYATNGKGKCPLTVKDAIAYVRNNFENRYRDVGDEKNVDFSKNVAISIDGGYFRYERSLPDVLDGLDLKIYENEILCIFGGNGSGKTTLLKILAGIRKLYKGKYRLFGKKIKEYGNGLYRKNLSMLPQNPRDLFVKSNVYDELYELTAFLGLEKPSRDNVVRSVAEKMKITRLFDRHPYDLSGGEAQKVAVAKILLLEPRVILLDEPTKGLDAYSKKEFSEILSDLKKQGKTIVAVTHDVEFAAEIADRCATFFDGKIVAEGNKADFFENNIYYTTSAARITRGWYNGAFTCDRAIKLMNMNKRTDENE